MLVLTIRIGERIVIGDPASPIATITRSRNNRFEIEADRSIPVNRGARADEILREGKDSSDGNRSP